MDRHAKIVATIGPASDSEEIITQLLQAGVNVARLNFSHGSHEDHTRVYQRLRAAAEKTKHPVTILQDLQGPKIRTGGLEKGQVELVPGQPFCLTTRPVPGDSRIVSVDFPQLPDSVRVGSRILLDDGNLELVVISVNGEDVETRVVIGGILKTRKGVNLPGVALDISSITAKDEADLNFGLELGVDAIAVSFVRSARDITFVRNAITRHAPEKAKIPLIAKLERPEALDNLDDILRVADGVMVARGDLGVEMSAEKVPIAQKEIIYAANRHAKFVITATQMLDSMIKNPRPTRAEASDVANAIFDGTDAVMLSGETAAGQYPVQSVDTMAAIICQAEDHMHRWGHWKGLSETETTYDDTFFMTQAARALAHDRNVASIAVFTKSGRTALLMSKSRPEVPILAFTPEEDTFHRMGLYWGVQPHMVPHSDTIEEMIRVVEAAMIESTPIQPGQQVVLICGYPVDKIRPTNLALLHTVGE